MEAEKRHLKIRDHFQEHEHETARRAWRTLVNVSRSYLSETWFNTDTGVYRKFTTSQRSVQHTKIGVLVDLLAETSKFTHAAINAAASESAKFQMRLTTQEQSE
jgi:hypothetical protein